MVRAKLELDAQKVRSEVPHNKNHSQQVSSLYTVIPFRPVRLRL